MINVLVRNAFQTSNQPQTINAQAHNEKHALSIATLRKYRDLSDLSRSQIISPVSKSYASPKQGEENPTDSENTFVT